MQRFALDRLNTLNKAGPIAAKDLQRMVMDDQVYQAAQVMPGLLQFCAAALGTDAPALTPLCASLKAWDRSANLVSGLGLCICGMSWSRYSKRLTSGVWRSIRKTRNTPRVAWRSIARTSQRRFANRCWHR